MASNTSMVWCSDYLRGRTQILGRVVPKWENLHPGLVQRTGALREELLLHFANVFSTIMQAAPFVWDHD